MIKMIHKNYDTQVCTFAVDSIDEMKFLPLSTRGSSLPDRPDLMYAVSIGSKAHVKSGNSVITYQLFSDGWVKLSNSPGGNSSGSAENPPVIGGDSEDYEFADRGDIDSMF